MPSLIAKIRHFTRIRRSDPDAQNGWSRSSDQEKWLDSGPAVNEKEQTGDDEDGFDDQNEDALRQAINDLLAQERTENHDRAKQEAYRSSVPREYGGLVIRDQSGDAHDHGGKSFGADVGALHQSV